LLLVVGGLHSSVIAVFRSEKFGFDVSFSVYVCVYSFYSKPAVKLQPGKLKPDKPSSKVDMIAKSKCLYVCGHLHV